MTGDLTCHASCVPLALTHPNEHPGVSGCTALPTHPRSRPSSWQEAEGRSPPSSTPTAPAWLGGSRVKGARVLLRIWLSCGCCCLLGTPGGILAARDYQCVPGCTGCLLVAGLSPLVLLLAWSSLRAWRRPRALGSSCCLVVRLSQLSAPRGNTTDRGIVAFSRGNATDRALLCSSRGNTTKRGTVVLSPAVVQPAGTLVVLFPAAMQPIGGVVVFFPW